MTIRALIWGENVHEHKDPTVAANYPNGMHAQIAALIGEDANIRTSTATLQDPEHGMTEARLAETDVLVWWGHAAHDEVDDAVVERIAQAVWQGMGLIVLHSGHHSKIFRRLMGTPCEPDTGARQASASGSGWFKPGHPIAKGLPGHFELENEEMYSEPFWLPEPLETVFISWFQGGEVFRSGPHLPARRGQRLLLPPRPRDLSDLSRPDGRQGAAQRGELGVQSAAACRTADQPEPPDRPGDRTHRGARPPRLGAPPALAASRQDAVATRLLMLGTGRMAHAQAQARLMRRWMTSKWSPGPTSMPANLDGCSAPTFGVPRSASLRCEAALDLGRVRRGGPTSRPTAVHHATTMEVIAAGKHVFCEKPLATNHAAGHGNDGGGGAGRADQHGQPHLPQCRRTAQGARTDRCRARSARSSTSRRATCSTGWRCATSAIPRSQGRGCGGCRRGTAPTARWATSASTSSTSPPCCRASTSSSMNCRLQTFGKVAGRPDGRICARRQ